MLMGALVPALGYRGMYVAASAVVALGLVYYAAVPGGHRGDPRPDRLRGPRHQNGDGGPGVDRV